ncbi:MAG: CRISPR-associated ring nuclease [Anaerolineae bacterium]|nr:CRISPR-associated ring nuclease [Anaerolineae bacterium]
MTALRPAALVATLGTQPQVVTIALDLLLRRGERVDEVVVIHTSSPQPGRANDSMRACLAALEREFPGRALYGHLQRPCRYRLVGLVVGGRAIEDVRNEAEARAAMAAIFHEVQVLKKRGLVVHLSIAGGRKSMAVYGMATAQLLFDSDDRLWHVFSSPAFEASGAMHPQGPNDADLVRIPVLPISTVFPGMVSLLTSPDPLAILDNKLLLMDLEGRRQRETFLRQLTDAERRLVDALMTPLALHGRPPDDRELARKLIVAPHTITKRFSDIYAKLRAHIGVLEEEERVDRSTLIYYLAPYYAERHP